MQYHRLRVGEEIVIEGICLTVLAIEEGKAFLGIPAAAPSDVPGPAVHQLRPRRIAGPLPLPSDN